jgi:glycosyltransferase involved in cell wall biosynthesis
MRVAALTSGLHVPSARFRVRQHIVPLRSYGVYVEEYTPAISKYAFAPDHMAGQPLARMVWPLLKVAARLPGIIGSWQTDVTWLERPMIEGVLTGEILLRRPYVLDVDDAIWLTPPFGAWATQQIARRADALVVGNSFLADWFQPHAARLSIIPTAIDTDRFRPRDSAATKGDGRFMIGWTGTQSTLPYLHAIERPLARLLARHADIALLVVSDVAPIFRSIPMERVIFRPWSPQTEAEDVRGMDVGVMPLPDNDWARGKCSFKMLQYMACGIPSVVSPIGLNRDILSLSEVGLAAVSEDDWYETLELLYTDRLYANRLGAQGREVCEGRFSRQIISEKIAAVFAQVV